MLNYYVFGAHSRGQTTAVYLKKLYPDWSFKGYLYDNDEVNPQDIDGFPVQNLKDVRFAVEDRVYIGTRGVYHSIISDKLKDQGAKDIVPVDVSLDTQLRGAFVADYFRDSGREFTRLENLPRNESEESLGYSKSLGCDIFVVKSSKDSPVGREVLLQPYEHFIQAGAAIDGKDLDKYEFFDDEPDGISEQNRQFCELTALYWVWKNNNADIKGIEHYRRRFILPAFWTSAFYENNFDVILPVPLYVRPSIEGNYLTRHIGETWEAMLNVLCEHDKEMGAVAGSFFKTTGCYSPCNMLIARRAVFDSLCSWLFSILFEVQERCGTYNDPYQNRYLGFLAERLITFYFFWKREQYSVVYADKTFLSN